MAHINGPLATATIIMRIWFGTNKVRDEYLVNIHLVPVL